MQSAVARLDAAAHAAGVAQVRSRIDPPHRQRIPARPVRGIAAIVDEQNLGAQVRRLEVALERPDGVGQECRRAVMDQKDRQVAHEAGKLPATARGRKAHNSPIGGNEPSLNG